MAAFTVTTAAVADLGEGPLVVQNLGTGELYVGDAGVSSAEGLKLKAGDTIAFGPGVRVRAVAATASADVRVAYGAIGASKAGA